MSGKTGRQEEVRKEEKRDEERQEVGQIPKQETPWGSGSGPVALFPLRLFFHWD